MTWTYAAYYAGDVFSSPILWFGVGWGLFAGFVLGRVRGRRR